MPEPEARRKGFPQRISRNVCKPLCRDTTYPTTLSAAKWPPRNPLISVRDWSQETIKAKLGVFWEDAIVDPGFPHELAKEYSASMVNDYKNSFKNVLCAKNPSSGKLECDGSQIEVIYTMVSAWNHYRYMEYASEKVRVSIFPESLEVKTEETSPKYDWVGFLSNIGGVMGLFTGFSILSFLEIVELLFDLGACLFAVVLAIKKVKSLVSP